MDLSQIRELLKIVADSGVAEVEIEEENFKLVVRLNAPNVSIQQASPFQMPPAMPYYPPAYGAPPPPAGFTPPAAAAAPAPPPAAPASEPAAAPATPANEYTVKAPIVGTLYVASSPDAPPYVSVGDKVKPGDVLCIIEAMKLMNEIECDVSGTIKQILIDNAEPVEYDQPLFIIDKD